MTVRPDDVSADDAGRAVARLRLRCVELRSTLRRSGATAWLLGVGSSAGPYLFVEGRPGVDGWLHRDLRPVDGGWRIELGGGAVSWTVRGDDVKALLADEPAVVQIGRKA